MYRPVKLYVDDVLVCTLPHSAVDGTVEALRKQGIINVRVEE